MGCHRDRLRDRGCDIGGIDACMHGLGRLPPDGESVACCERGAGGKAGPIRRLASADCPDQCASTTSPGACNKSQTVDRGGALVLVALGYTAEQPHLPRNHGQAGSVGNWRLRRPFTSFPPTRFPSVSPLASPSTTPPAGTAERWNPERMASQGMCCTVPNAGQSQRPPLARLHSSNPAVLPCDGTQG